MAQTVLITGTSSGIGRAAVEVFGSQGWNVIGTLRDTSGVPKDQPDNLLTVRLDVRERASIEEAIETGIERFGRIDALINNAGYGQYGLFESITREKVHEQFDVNVFGVMDMTRSMLPHFHANGRGLIINVGSGAGIFAMPMISLYCASKFALEGFTEALAYELASQNIVVKIVEPHGGVTGTSFNVRSGKEVAENASVDRYDAFTERTSQTFADFTAARRLSSEDVAQEIYRAATDGSKRLRYLIGIDSRNFIRARREWSEEEYEALMRSYFPVSPDRT
jgi:NAD(P)-dependent dehydrogenase (short-subunit alcohol dehydrogenase family)